MKKVLRFFYVALGHTMCRICLIWANVRDRLFPPKEDSVLIIAHPDDDTLFFHTYIKKHKPYVALMTDGWSIERMRGFRRAMKYYGLRWRAYPLSSRDKRVHLLKRNVEKTMKIGRFSTCITHNETGEYGHEMHIRVHNAVASAVKCTLLCTADASRITDYPLSADTIAEKEAIFRSIYTTETFVLDQYADWVRCERLERAELPYV